MNLADVSIEKNTGQFLVENKEIENRYCSYNANYYISNHKDVLTYLLHSFVQNKHLNYNQKEEEVNK